jgi:hypothetical protein
MKQASNLDALRATYTAIVTEEGRRVTRSPEVARFMETAGAILAEDQADQVDVSVAIETGGQLLHWLREQEAQRADEGGSYPAAAYAYAPDAATPSTWKLRLWEDPTKKVTRAQLGRAAAALSPGGFRGKRVDIPVDALPAVKRRIRAEYRKLGISDNETPRWVKEAEMRTLVAEMIPMTEANVTTTGRGQVVVIQPGFNRSKKRFYPKETLARDFGIFEGAKMYADHPSEAENRDRPERSIKDWVAVLENVHVRGTDGAVVGDYTVVEPWLEAKLAKLRDAGQLDKIGVSINAVGSASRQDIEGHMTNYVERLIAARSVDFVTEPGAGGAVEIFEADRETELDVDLVTAEGFRDRRPDLVEVFIQEAAQEKQTELKSIKEANMDLQEQVTQLTQDNETLVKERDDAIARATTAEGQLTESQAAQDKAVAQATIKEAIGEAELPDASKKRLLANFSEATSTEGVTEAIEAERTYLQELTEAGTIKNLGPAKDKRQETTETDKAALVESFKDMGLSDEEAKIAAGS